MLLKYSSRNKNSAASAANSRYPYTYARTAVLRSRLIDKQDYSKLLKMGLNEIASYLESTEYKKEIDELALSYKGQILLEIALNKNLANTFSKLRRISTPQLRALLDLYLVRVHISNVKTIIRGKFTKEEEKEIIGMMSPLDEESAAKLAKKQTIEEVLLESKILTNQQYKEAIESFKQSGTLTEIENKLDKSYIEETLNLAEELPRQSKLKQFITEEIKARNILNILRFRREGFEKKEIIKNIFGISPLLRRLIDASKEESAAIIDSEYGEDAKKGTTELAKSGNISQLELDLQKKLLKMALRMQKLKPLVADSILGYMFAKEIEVRNIKMIVKGKQLGLENEFIEEQLII